jgi:hypothetical protein
MIAQIARIAVISPLMLLALAALSTAQAAEPTGTLTLACEGTAGFSGTAGNGAAIFGTVDRITGDVEAATEHWNYETNKLRWAKGYSLKCKPTQGMF